MHRRLSRAILATVLVSTALISPASADPAESVVAEWNRHALTALLGAAPNGAALPPPPAVVHLAMVQGAVYDAVNAIAGGHEPYLAGLDPAPATASQEAAAATAAHHVLIGTLASRIDEAWLDAEYVATLAEIATGVSAADLAAGVAAGEDAAAAMLAERADDGRFGSFRFTVGTAPGQWRPTSGTANDPFAWVARVDPFLLDSASQVRTDGPLPMTSAEYAAEYNEVKALGSATGSTRTQAQTDLAMFFTFNPVEMYNRTFRGVADRQGLATAEQARLLAMLNLSGADALIGCWDDKAHWSFWRPVTAIRLGADDGNPATEPDPAWTSLGVSPPYPDHPSGFNCVTGAMMHSAASFFGTKKVSFDLVLANGTASRHYDRLTDVIKDTIEARVCLGIHFRTPDVQGAVLGKKVAHWLDQHYLRPTD